MPNFRTGLIVGLGIGVLFAPLSGREMRRLIGKRAQQLRLSAAPSQLPAPSTHSTQSTQNVASSTQPVHTSTAQHTSPSPNLRQTTNTTPTITQSSTTNTPQPSAVHLRPLSQDTIPTDERLISRDAAPLANTDANEKTVPLASPGTSKIKTTTTDQRSLAAIPGITPEQLQTFKDAGITTQQQLLQRTPTKEAASDLAHAIGTSVRVMRHAVTSADLLRLPGADTETVSLLEQAGVTSCQDLQQRNPEHLHAKLLELQTQQDTHATVPDLDTLTTMISAASNLAASNHA
jgi:gas vesicle protein